MDGSQQAGLAMSKNYPKRRGGGALVAALAVCLCVARVEATGVLYQFGNASQVQNIIQPAVSPLINGSVVFSGAATMDAPFPSATEFTSIFGTGSNTNPSVVGTSGDYSPVPIGTLALFTPFTFSPLSSSSTNFTLWSFGLGATSYSFFATAVTSVFENANFLNITGTGIASITGFSDTAGTWTITSTGAGQSPTFSFGAGSTAVPEPSTVALLVFLTFVTWVFLNRASARRQP